MRQLLFFLILAVFFNLSLNAQNDSLIDGVRIISNGWICDYVDGPCYRYCNDKKCNGKIIDTFPNGQIKHKGFYKDGELYGMVYDYYENGQLENYGKCKENIKIGKWKFYYPSGKIRSEVTYKNKEIPIKWIDYYENGQIENIYETYRNCFKKYEYSFSQQGDTLTAYYPIDLKNKIYRYWEKFNNGQLEKEGHYQYIMDYGWKEIGKWKWYNEKGECIKQEEY